MKHNIFWGGNGNGSGSISKREVSLDDGDLDADYTWSYTTGWLTIKVKWQFWTADGNEITSFQVDNDAATGISIIYFNAGFGGQTVYGTALKLG